MQKIRLYDKQNSYDANKIFDFFVFSALCYDIHRRLLPKSWLKYKWCHLKWINGFKKESIHIFEYSLYNLSNFTVTLIIFIWILLDLSSNLLTTFIKGNKKMCFYVDLFSLGCFRTTTTDNHDNQPCTDTNITRCANILKDYHFLHPILVALYHHFKNIYLIVISGQSQISKAVVLLLVEDSIFYKPLYVNNILLIILIDHISLLPLS